MGIGNFNGNKLKVIELLFMEIKIVYSPLFFILRFKIELTKSGKSGINDQLLFMFFTNL